MTRAIERARRAHIPAGVLLTLTHKCQLACSHCYQAAHDSDDLPAETWIALFDELALLGTLDLIFSGGEALLRKDALKLIAEARKRMFSVTLFSNGGPITPAVARSLRELRVARVEISIHGSHAATHDGFVGRQGSFARAVRAVELLDDAGVPVLVKSSAVRCNVEELDALEQLFANRPRVRFSTDVMLHRRDDGASTLGERVTPEQLAGYVDSQLARLGDDELAANGRRLSQRPGDDVLDARQPCGAGRSFASIQPNGDVLACVQLPTMKMGNLREQSFTELWLDSPPVRALRALTLRRFEECRGCAYRHVCAKCPALSLSEGDSIDGHSRQVCERTKAYWGAVEKRLAGTPLARTDGRAVGPFPTPRSLAHEAAQAHGAVHARRVALPVVG